eukprot:3579920-Rhodomonas_salina.1
MWGVDTDYPDTLTVRVAQASSDALNDLVSADRHDLSCAAPSLRLAGVAAMPDCQCQPHVLLHATALLLAPPLAPSS